MSTFSTFCCLFTGPPLLEKVWTFLDTLISPLPKTVKVSSRASSGGGLKMELSHPVLLMEVYFCTHCMIHAPCLVKKWLSRERGEESSRSRALFSVLSVVSWCAHHILATDAFGTLGFGTSYKD